MATLYELTSAQAQIEDALYENGGELTPELEALMTETAAALPAKIDGYNHILARMAGMEAQADMLKAHLLNAMQAFNIEKIEGSTCKVFRRTGAEAVEVTDEAAILSPAERVVAERLADLPAWIDVKIGISKTALKAALQNGALVAGAGLVRNESVVIK